MDLSNLLIFSCLVVMSSASDYVYGAPKPNVYQKPKVKHEYDNLLPKTIAIQGLILCKSGLNFFPLKGAVARITCLAENEDGYEMAPFSVISKATDAKGYFFATLCPTELEGKSKITECKAFLEDSPLDSCKVPTDVNNGISGSVLSSYRILNHNNMKLYSLGPFFYTSEPKSLPDVN